MSNSLGIIRSSTNIDAVRNLQPKMFLNPNNVRRIPPTTISEDYNIFCILVFVAIIFYILTNIKKKNI